MLYTKVLQVAFTDDLGADVKIKQGDLLSGRLGLLSLEKVKARQGEKLRFGLRQVICMNCMEGTWLM